MNLALYRQWWGVNAPWIWYKYSSCPWFLSWWPYPNMFLWYRNTKNEGTPTLCFPRISIIPITIRKTGAIITLDYKLPLNTNHTDRNFWKKLIKNEGVGMTCEWLWYDLYMDDFGMTLVWLLDKWIWNDIGIILKWFFKQLSELLKRQ